MKTTIKDMATVLVILMTLFSLLSIPVARVGLNGLGENKQERIRDNAFFFFLLKRKPEPQQTLAIVR